MSGPERYGRSDAELAVLPIGLAAGSFAGQVVIISGAGTGIGRACAHWFARLGADVVLCGRNAERLAAVMAGESDDHVIIAGASDVENLCTDLGRKVWQKIMILGELDERQ